MSTPRDNYIKAHSKSQFVGFILTLLFGPLGLFYSGWVSAIILTVVAIASVSTLIGPIICWVLAIIISFFAVRNFNKKVTATADLTSSRDL